MSGGWSKTCTATKLQTCGRQPTPGEINKGFQLLLVSNTLILDLCATRDMHFKTLLARSSRMTISQAEEGAVRECSQVRRVEASIW